MSSGTVKNNYQNVPKINIPITALFKFDKNQGQKCKFQFISELVKMLFEKKHVKDGFLNISKLITLSLQESCENFADILFTGSFNHNVDSNNHGQIDEEFNIYHRQKFCDDKEISLLMLNRVRSIFNNCSNLTNEQKFDYCSIERYFMKQYLRKY